MATISELLTTIESTITPIAGGINSDGVYDQTGLTQQQIDDIDALFATWDAQTPAQKLQSEDFQDVKAKVVAIKNALNNISDPSAITLNNDFVVYDTDGVTALLTVPDDTEWSGMTNAQVKTFIREFTLTYARVLQYAIAQKAGYLDIKKFIRDELNDN